MNYLIPQYMQQFDINNINIEYHEDNNETYINKTFFMYLKKLKHIIHKKQDLWNTYKIYMNTYEYIHTSYYGKLYISRLIPVSRSFYKLVELNHIYHFLDNIHGKKYDKIRSLHIAEGPGGFIQSMKYLRKKQKSYYNGKIDLTQDLHIGMTLISNDTSVPTWNKLKDIYDNDKTICLDNGPKNNGDLFDINNFEYVYKKYGSSMNVITADGGFDFSKNYDNQEQNMLKLLYVQMLYALICQKKHGDFIMKIFDISNYATCEIIYILNSFYKKIYITKPVTSRPGNSEKYIVCKDFKQINNINSYYKYFHKCIREITSNELYIKRLLKTELPLLFVKTLENINSIIGQHQIENINATLILIDNDIKVNENLLQIKKNNIYKCIQWCKLYDIPTYPLHKIKIPNVKIIHDHYHQYNYQKNKNDNDNDNEINIEVNTNIV